MRALPLVLFSNVVLAHPGHGKPGFVHFHEFSDGLMIAVGFIAIGLLCWAWRK